MNKLAALHAHIRSLNLVDENQIDSFADQITYRIGGRDITAGYAADAKAIMLADVKYTANLLIENYKGDARLVLAHVIAWVMASDDDRENQDAPDPTLQVIKLDDHQVDLEFSIAFEEELVLIEDEAGTIAFNGSLWSLADPEINVAEVLRVMTPADDTAWPPPAEETP